MRIARHRAWWLAAVAVVCLAALLRAETLGQRPLWTDELAVRIFVTRAAREGGYLYARSHPPIPGARTEAHLAPLHTLLVYGATSFGVTPTVLRLPSLASGVAAVALIVWLGCVVCDRRTALCAGFLMAISVYQINYAQDARAYALLLCLTIAQFLAFFLFLERRSALRLTAFVASGAASLYAHHLGALNQVALAGLAGSFFALDRRDGERTDRSRRRLEPTDLALLAAAFAAIGLLYLPQLGSFLDFAASGVARPKWTLWPSPRFFHELVARWGGGRGAITVAYELAFAIGAVAVLRGRSQVSALLLWLAVPLLFFATVPFSKFFDVRYLMAAYPPFVLLVARGVVALADASLPLALRLGVAPGRAARIPVVVFAASLLVFSAAGVRGYGAFRVTTLRCSEFYRLPELLHSDEGFCRRYIVLNSLVPEDAYLLRHRPR